MNNLAYRTWGIRGRPALVLLHGFLGDSEDWLPLVSLLEDDFYLVAVDLPGHAKSRSIELPDNNAFTAFSDILDLTLQQLDLKRYSLLGYSLGGRLALLHSLSHGDRVEQLLLESCHPGLESETDRSIRRQTDQEWAERFRTEPLDEVLQRWYHQPVFADLNSQQRQALMAHRLGVNQDGQHLGDILDHCSLSRQPACWGRMEDVSFPVHYFYGERDLKFAEIALRLHKSGSLSGLHKIAAAGHNVHCEQPSGMADVIRQQLSHVDAHECQVNDFKVKEKG
ncbi:2-succinyl-6-hydroxy-2,4-cyclohexadiene-1-carboxylate synthase [Endozoicomonas montiporae]|uniref:Putative 2-succinyl-6-hydroxy-2,4-cyclohexadiene-1-carboxylate synthase n=1 Tax=Endozoicomonas montiporae CL-33 TaxID=570277 RepID=A0A142BEV4_9GAMM|nr:2-succinyl-6-hydroxy-2,4-cyclohexadiene-1-carboxylate synthase [Endozoicomonas montiporae]AMO57280.1 2-succinyl-6-hydroxy-2,4-cyclohexadiene-1-carboxylate synthase [Endozoicomonas montiporae CL-33]